MQNKTLSNEMLIISKVIKLVSQSHIEITWRLSCFIFNESHPRLDSGVGVPSVFVLLCFLTRLSFRQTFIFVSIAQDMKWSLLNSVILQ